MAVIFDKPRRQIHPVQLTTLNYWCEKYRPKVIVEVGCWLGESTAVFGKYAKKNGAKVYAVDWWRDNPEVGLFVDCLPNSISVEEQFAINMFELGLDGVVFPVKKESTDAARGFADRSIDLFFLDGDHRYSQAKRDIRAWLPKIKFGGVMCGHDFESKNWRNEYLEQDIVGGKHHGVIKAVMSAFPQVRQEERMWIQDGIRNDSNKGAAREVVAVC